MIGRSTFLLAGAATVIAIAACHKTGTMNTAASPAASQNSVAAKPAANGLPAGVTAMMVAQGDSLFHARSCRNCHGMDAKGSRGGPDLTSGDFMHVSGSYEDFVKIITTGIPREEIKDSTHHNPMPARGGGRPAPLTDDQIKDVAAYVYSLSHK
jgi:mono/diheme cytochrome c family protein